MKILVKICFILVVLPNLIYSQNFSGVKENLWKPQKDDVFLQEVSKKIPTESPVLSVAEYQGKCYAIISNNVYLLEGSELNKVDSAPSGVTKLMQKAGNLWALANNGIYRLTNNKWTKIDDHNFVDLCMHNGQLYAATREEIFRLEGNKIVSIKPADGYYSSDITMVMEDGTQIHADPVRLGPINRIASYSGTLYALRPNKLILFDGKKVDTDFIDWGLLPSKTTRDLLSFGSRLFVGTDRGLSVLRGASLTTLKGKDGLPNENTTCLEKGFDNDIWIGTTSGAVRMLENDWHYFGADHWLPGENVHDIAVGDKIVYIATDGGLGVISYEPYTLLKKAAYYERHLEEWGHKRLGFIHLLYKKDGEWVREISDNDGGHTAPYLTAMCYKYAVTGDPEARKEAVNSFYAMLWLDRVTPVDGFIARSIWSTTADKDEMGKQGSGGLPAKWYPTPDGKWFWKGDTSSDEVTAHFYSVSVFYDLVAEGKEKELAREHLKRMANYIIDCGWVMNDMDGKPTRWARWNPEYLLRPYGYNDRGVNSLEVLSYIQAAYSVTGDEKFSNANQQLSNWGYPELTLRQKNTFPPATLAPWDDNLAFESYYTLLRYVEDPDLKSVYLRSLERSWEVKRMEHIPWFNFVYGAATGNDCELEQSVKHLREWTLDCTTYNYTNSNRDDLNIEPGYISYEQGVKSLSPRETAVKGGSRNATVLDGGGNGNRVQEPTGYLRDYWMGRYHGFIEAPESTEPDLISVKSRNGQKFGAESFNGPGRPEIK